MENLDYFFSLVKQLNIEPSQKMVDQFTKYYELLIDWNKRMNLTAITEEIDVIKKHFVDSLLIVKAMDLSKVNSILDVGTGAGFPGVPLKIVFPNVQLVLMDSVNKKIQFLEEVSNQLNLEYVTCLHGRAEDFAKSEIYRGQFDLVVSRAVSNLSTLSEYCIPFVKKQACFVAYKSADCDLELEDAKHAINKLGGNIENVIQLNIPDTDIIRTYVSIRKIKDTPNEYPRKAGIPAKKPL